MSSRTKHKKNEELAIAIPVTPMLDMAFQLLTFFIFTYHPSEMKEGQMEMMLPGGGTYKAQKQEDVNPESMSDPEVDAQSKITLRVGTQKGDEGGAIRFPIEIEGLSKESAGSLKDLEAKLVTMRGAEKSGEKMEGGASDSVKIEGDKKLKWQFVVEIMDACKRAGYHNVGFAPPPD